MPAVSKKQQRWAGMQLAKKRRGEKPQTDMSEVQLEDFARKPKGKKLPEKVKAHKR